MRDQFKKFIRQKGLRYTTERDAILEGVMGLKGHFDPEGLLASSRHHEAGVSLASVYRTIPLLLDSGIIKQVETSEKHSKYEIAAGREHHDHMLCVGCGRVIEFYSPHLERLQDRLCREREFTGIAHTLEIRGLCRKCGARG